MQKYTTLFASVLALGWIFPVHAKTAGLAANEICASTDHHFVGPCFKIHARLQLGADTIEIWIWPVGTHRYLGYVGYVDLGSNREPCGLPSGLLSPLLAGRTIFANIIVRAISKKEPGHMQFVCIAAATHLVVVDHPP
ncbi:MAG: hypothetical protein ACYCYH_16910 [Steroidobacteraceae bacterium]